MSMAVVRSLESGRREEKDEREKVRRVYAYAKLWKTPASALKHATADGRHQQYCRDVVDELMPQNLAVGARL